MVEPGSPSPLAPKRRWKPLACGCLAVSATLVALAVPIAVSVFGPGPKPDPPLLAWKASELSISALAFSPRGDVLASGGRDKTIRLWNPRDGRLLQEVKGGGWVEQLVFSQDGTKLGAAAACVDVYAVISSSLTWVMSEGIAVGLKVRVSPSLDRFVARDTSGVGTVTGELNNSQRGFTFLGPSTMFHELALTPDGSRVAFGFDDGSVETFLVSGDFAGNSQGKIKILHGAVCGLDFSGDGLLLAIGTNYAEVAVVSSATMMLKGVRTPVAFAFSRDGKLLAAADLGGVAIVWDLEGKLPPLRWHVGRDNSLYTVAFSPDGERIAAAGEDGTIRIFPAR